MKRCPSSATLTIVEKNAFLHCEEESPHHKFRHSRSKSWTTSFSTKAPSESEHGKLYVVADEYMSSLEDSQIFRGAGCSSDHVDILNRSGSRTTLGPGSLAHAIPSRGHQSRGHAVAVQRCTDLARASPSHSHGFAGHRCTDMPIHPGISKKSRDTNIHDSNQEFERCSESEPEKRRPNSDEPDPEYLAKTPPGLSLAPEESQQAPAKKNRKRKKKGEKNIRRKKSEPDAQSHRKKEEKKGEKKGIQKSSKWLQEVQEPPAFGMTTVMVKNIPCRYTRQRLLREFLPLGFVIDFVFLPYVPHATENAGYCFVNFVWWQQAAEFIEVFDDHRWNLQHGSRKRAEPCFANIQGFANNVNVFCCKGRVCSKSRFLPYVDAEAHIREGFDATSSKKYMGDLKIEEIPDKFTYFPKFLVELQDVLTHD